MATTVTVNTANKDIDYIQRDFTSVVDALITYSNINFGPGTSANRLWTNFNADSFSRTWLELVAFVADVFFFYFDNQATQSYLQTASVRSAVKDIAKQFGFVPATATSASGIATFTVNGAGTISRGFRVRSSNGEEFYLTNDVIAILAGDVQGNVLQGLIVNENFVAEGLQAEEFNLAGPTVVRDLTNTNPLDISPQIVVNGNAYTLVDTFIRNNGEDTPVVKDSLGNVIGGGRVFMLGERPDGTPYIRFGDGIFGRKLVAGENVTINYRSGGGSAGNIVEQTLTTLVSSNAIVTSVTNDEEFSGGADEQSLEQLRELIPASLRTLERAVSESDFPDILTANFSEVQAASAEPNTEDAGIDINIYVVPQGIGIPQISNNIILRNRLSNFIDRRKMVTIQFQILDAFSVDTLFTLEIFIADTASKTTVSQAIVTALQNLFDLNSGGASGSGIGFAEPILLKDINNIIESIDGVERFEIKRLTYRPRIDARVIGLLSEYKTSDVTVYPTIEELEWLAAAAGPVNSTPGVLVFSNTGLIAFTYNSSTGEIAYAFPVDLSEVGAGYLFRDGSNTDFTILGVDTTNNKVFLQDGLTINNTVSNANHGSIRTGSTSYESFKVFKKIRAQATNLSVDSITDNNLDLSIANGTAAAIAPRVLLDNVNVFIPQQYATGDFYLVDAASNIWEIVSNDSNTLTTSITAINDGSITNVTGGAYKIVRKMIGRQVIFNGNIFNVQFNNASTIFSIGAQFNQIGTIGDEFQISQLQTNIGKLGVAVDLISYDAGTGEVRLNSAPNLQGVNTEYVLIDADGQIFNIVGADNRSKPSVFYDSVNQNSEFTVEGVGLGSQVAQGFKVSDTDVYAVVSMNLKLEGNVIGSLTARIVDDDGTGLPDLGSPVAVSTPININTISDSAFEKVLFSFTTPPTLNAATQYHLVLSPDAGYIASKLSGVKSFDNTGLVAFTYNNSSGVITYGASVNLSAVLPGHYFKDSAGTFFKILAVDDTNDEITIASGQTVGNTVTTSEDGAVYINDRILVGTDSSSPTYADGEFSRYDGTNWSNSTLGPSPSGVDTDAIFSVEGTKTIKIESDLVPVLEEGATISARYYDDENEISFVVGLSSGTITFATDVNATGRGTVGGEPNRKVDRFIFRTSRYADDIVNLRPNEIPQVKASDINIQIFGGVD